MTDLHQTFFYLGVKRCLNQIKAQGKCKIRGQGEWEIR